MATHTRTIVRRRLIEHPVPGRRVGRHVEHDPKSRDYPYAAGEPISSLRSLKRGRRIQAFDQADIGSCTGNASTGAQATAPFKNPLRARGNSQRVPLAIYELATHLDGFPGVYRPDDTGSSGLAAAKALRRRGVVSSYRHAFELGDVIAALADPTVGVILGTDWYDSFDETDSSGEVAISRDARVRGGHEYQASGIELVTPGTYTGDDLVWFWQSWGAGWGVSGGRFCMRVSTLDALLQQQGDCTILVP